MSELQLGKLENSYSVAPAYLQRAVVVAVASFVCFLAMMAGFYIRQNIGYFLLSTAFLIVYILTMVGLLLMKRNVVNIYSNGIAYKKFAAVWGEIGSAEIKTDARGVKQAEIVKNGGEFVILSESIQNIEQIVGKINEKIINE